MVQMPGDGIHCRKLAHHLAKADGGIEAVPDRKIVAVADSSFAAIRSSAAIRRHVCLVTRLRLDPNIFAPALGHPAEGQQRRLWRPWKTCWPCTRDLDIPLVCSDEIFPANHDQAVNMRDREEPPSKSALRY
ncbi:MAG: hypothetical protein M3178_13950 [Pseudomonadota bacterium]|nr:hypothetical protein [Pseudomonadota bacterium]